MYYLYICMNTYICIFVYLFKYLYVSSGDNDSRRGWWLSLQCNKGNNVFEDSGENSISLTYWISCICIWVLTEKFSSSVTDIIGLQPDVCRIVLWPEWTEGFGVTYVRKKERKKRECVHVSSFGKASATHGKGYVTTCWTIAAIATHQGDIKKINLIWARRALGSSSQRLQTP